MSEQLIWIIAFHLGLIFGYFIGYCNKGEKNDSNNK